MDKNSVDAEYITSRLFHDCDEEELLLYDSKLTIKPTAFNPT